ncbi:probable G-protein coupled receptor Mth-like 7 [Drosophila takahashii]|uniref:probable G-protein coupled receptor Mth-like 7 n=1 Tax=Drosophila takahashii TaxID=29030 RepID=UPI001CF9272A|nr:probable G-protein coupled receptor Mth-like 7 [Drosophila takahashii]
MSLIDILNYLNLLDDICSLKGYSHYFFGMSIYLWFTVMSFHMWKTFKSAICEVPGYNFLTYSFFVWGTAGVSTGVIYLVNQVWKNEVIAINWIPVVGFTKCYVENNTCSSWIYLHGPKLILSSFNLILFILTAVHIQKVKSELKRFKQRQVESPICLQFDILTYLQFLRLSAIMGVFYIGSFGGFLSTDNMWYPVITVAYYVHQSFGIFVFVLLVLKRSTFKMIMDRYRERN